MKLSDMPRVFSLDTRLMHLQQALEEINQGASPTLKVVTEESGIDLWFGSDDMRASLCGLLQSEIDKCKRELAALGVDVEG